MELDTITTSFGRYFYCQARRCKRVFPANPDVYPRRQDRKAWYEELGDWFIYLMDNDVLLVRCPQHIGDNQLQATMGRTNENRSWAKQAKIRDQERRGLTARALPISADILGEDI